MGKRGARRGTCRNASLLLGDQKAPRFALLLDFPRFLDFFVCFPSGLQRLHAGLLLVQAVTLDLTFRCSSSNGEMLPRLDQTDRLQHPR